MVVEKVYRSCLLNFVVRNTYVDLVILEMVVEKVFGFLRNLQYWILMLKR